MYHTARPIRFGNFLKCTLKLQLFVYIYQHHRNSLEWNSAVCLQCQIRTIFYECKKTEHRGPKQQLGPRPLPHQCPHNPGHRFHRGPSCNCGEDFFFEFSRQNINTVFEITIRSQQFKNWICLTFRLPGAQFPVYPNCTPLSFFIKSSQSQNKNGSLLQVN